MVLSSWLTTQRRMLIMWVLVAVSKSPVLVHSSVIFKFFKLMEKMMHLNFMTVKSSVV